MRRTFFLYPAVAVFMLLLVVPLYAKPAKAAKSESGMSYDAALQKAIRYTRARNYKRSRKYFKLAVTADPTSMDPYFNVGSIAEHFQECADQLLYFRGFLYLATQGGASPSYLKSAKRAIRRCKRDKNTGYLSIKTEQPGLEVLINGALVGKTPINELPLSAGKYTYAIKAPLYLPFSKEIEIQAKQTTEEKPALVKKTFYGWLDIRPVPKEGVKVFINKKEAGVTPMKKRRVKTGSYLVVLKKDGYDTWQRYVEVNKDATSVVDAQLEKVISPKKLNMDRWKKFKE